MANSFLRLWRLAYVIPAIAVVMVFVAFVLVQQRQGDEFNLSYHINDTNQLITIDDIKIFDHSDWKVVSSRQVNFGYTQHPVWLKIPGEVFYEGINVLNMNFPALDFVSLFLVNRENKQIVDHQKSGDHIKLEDKAFETGKILFVFNKPGKIFDAYVEIVTSGSNQTPIILVPLKVFVEDLDAITNIFHLFMGFILFAFLLYLTSFFVYRDISYLYALIVAISLAVFYLFYYRINTAYLPSLSIPVQHYVIIHSQIFAFFGAIKYVQTVFLSWGYYKYDKLLSAIVWFSVPIFILCFLIPYQSSLYVLFIYYCVAAPSILVMLFLFVLHNRMSRHLGSAIILLGAWVCFMLGTTSQGLGEIGILYHGYFVNNSMLLGSIGVVFCAGLILSNNIQLDHEERLCVERDLALANQRLHQTDKLNTITSISSGLIHEIKNPLNWAKMSITTALDGFKLEDELREILDDCFSGIERIETTINSLNWFATSRNSALVKGVSLAGIVSKVFVLAKAECRSIDVTVNIDDEITVYGSETHLAQVMINLLTNSVKAINDAKDGRKGEIIVNACWVVNETCDDVRRVLLTWYDNGSGISQENLAKVFDPLFTTNPSKGGTGLGMCIVSQVIDKHEGSIDIASEKGEWTRVMIYLNEG